MPDFTAAFQQQLEELLKWRRDVRHFKTNAVDADVLQHCLNTFQFAPSVGLSEPWRVVHVVSDTARQRSLENFKRCNDDALQGYAGDQAKLYADLKLSGMQDAPVQLAVYCDDATAKGSGLGAQTMPETRRYSVVGAINQFWLIARAYGLGMGWVSIIDPDELNRDLQVPENWSFVAYLCVGWPKEESATPELERMGWEQREYELPIVER